MSSKTRWSGKSIRASNIQALFTGETDVKPTLLLFKMAQNSKNLRLNGHTSFEFQTRNYKFRFWLFDYNFDYKFRFWL